jgi:hypothetical protein
VAAVASALGGGGEASRAAGDEAAPSSKMGSKHRAQGADGATTVGQAAGGLKENLRSSTDQVTTQPAREIPKAGRIARELPGRNRPAW